MNALLIPTAVNTLKGICAVTTPGNPCDFKLRIGGLVFIKISDGKLDRNNFTDRFETLETIREHLALGHYVDILAEDIDWTGQNKMTLQSEECYILIRTDLDPNGRSPSNIPRPIRVLEAEIQLP
jgi:hypothetical protein